MAVRVDLLIFFGIFLHQAMNGGPFVVRFSCYFFVTAIRDAA